jgi:CubicO group peptidase (beta-lactamase class C family)
MGNRAMKQPDAGEGAIGSTTAEAAQAIAERVFASQPMPALSLAVARGDGVVWQTALGKADLEFDVPAAPAHLFRVGSVSKVVTAVAAARLVKRGLIELDTPIAYWLPELPAHHRATTLRQLFTHRGGVRHYEAKDLDPKAPGGSIVMRRYDTRDDVFSLFIDDPLVAEPGAKVSYSSFGYTLASYVMEAAAGSELTRLIDEQVARPFGLASLTPDDVLAVVPGRARGYHSARELEFIAARMPEAAPPRIAGEFANMTLSNPAFCWAGAGYLMSVPDMARFGAALLDGPHARIGAEERELLFTPMTAATENSPPLGLGWRVDEDAKGRRRWHHAGTTTGGRAGLANYPELGLSVALASNTMMAPGDVLGPASELADVFG